MTAMKGKTMAALAICALALTALGGAKNPVTHPTKGNGHITMVVDLATCHTEFTQWGVATHLGLWTDSGEGVLDGTFSYFVSGGGTIVAANGDTIDWEFTSPTSNLYIGGSGRFQGVKGGLTNLTITWAAEPFDNGDGTMTLEFTYDMVGTITY